jgi:predicted phosphodiesterase
MKPKYIRVVSDLHLEQYVGTRAEVLRNKFIPHDEQDAESVLVLAGDISSKPSQLLEFLREVEKFFFHVIYIAGNHEFYNHEMKEWSEDLNASLKDGPFDDPENPKTTFETLNVGCKEFENVRIIYGTLWADGGHTLWHQSQVGRYLTDFRIIRIGEQRFTVQDMMGIHKRQKNQIQKFLEQPFDGITIVATHHVPSYKLCHPRFGDDCNGGFASNCDAMLHSPNNPSVWIHGHTHDEIDRMVGDTRVICNPSGYRHETDPEYHNFHPVFIDLANPKGHHVNG